MVEESEAAANERKKIAEKVIKRISNGVDRLDRKYRSLYEQKAKAFKTDVRFYYWDIESWSLNPANCAFIVVKAERPYEAETPEYWLFMTDSKQSAGEYMFDWLLTLDESKRHIFYAHNGNKFDIYALFEAYELRDMEKLGGGSTIYEFKMNKSVWFRDSYHLLNAPLSSYGAKGETPDKFINEENPDFGNMDSITKEDIDYCILDVDILRDAIVNLRKEYREWTETPDADLPMTSASLAYRVWCHFAYPDEWGFWDKKNNYRYQVAFVSKANECGAKCFYGGRVQVYEGFAGREIYNVMSFDRNSMYPAEMKDKPFPDPANTFEANPTISRVWRLINNSDDLFWGEFVLEATCLNAQLFLPVIENGKADYTKRRFEGFLMNPEVEYALENGWELKEVRELYRAKPIYIFRDFIDYFYSERLKLKAQGDNRQAFYKLVMNSTFGKFGSKDRFERIENYEDVEAIMSLDNWRDYFEAKSWSIHTPEFYLQAKQATIRPRCTFYPISAICTSYARVELQKRVHQFQELGYEVVYTDTDSIHVHNLRPDSKIPIPIGKELGEWDFEFPKDWSGGWIPKAVYWERKAYTWFGHDGKPIKIKHKGVSDSDGDLTKEQTNRSVIKYKTALRRNIKSGIEVKTPKRSKKYYVEESN